MLCVIIIIIISNILCQVDGGDVKVNIVRWNVSRQNDGAGSYNFRSTREVYNNNIPLHIILENYNTSVSSVICQDYKGQTTFPVNFDENNKYNLTIKVEKITDSMSTKWTCTVKRKKDNGGYFEQQVMFTIRIKYSVKAYVGRTYMNFTKLKGADVDYDGVASYWYEDGEIIDLTCNSTAAAGDLGYRCLTYYNSNGKKLFYTEQIGAKWSANVRKRMTEEHDGDYIDCTFTINDNIKNTYRIQFKMKSGPASTNPIIISINDKRLVPAQNGNNDTYQYRFIKDDRLIIKCKTSENLRLEFVPAILQPYLHPGIKDSPGHLFGSVSLGTENKTISCIDKFKKYSAEILFLPDETDPIIRGLNAANIIQQYSKTSAVWVIDYQYTVNQTLNLTCTARTPGREQWSMEMMSKKNDRQSRGVQNYSLFLGDGHDGASIVCDIHEGRTIINLHLKTDVEGFILPEDTLAMIGAVAVSAIALVIVFLLLYRKHRKNKSRQGSCENLTHTHEDPIPAYPSQWMDNDYTYIAEGVLATNSLYISAAPVYARPQKKKNEPLYHTIEPVYSEPITEHEGTSGLNRYTDTALRNVKNIDPMYCEIGNTY